MKELRIPGNHPVLEEVVTKKDDREFIPGDLVGMWVKNPDFTGSTYEIFTPYPITVIAPLLGIKRYMKSKDMFVTKMPNNQMYISEYENGEVCCTEGEEGVNFVLKKL